MCFNSGARSLRLPEILLPGEWEPLEWLFKRLRLVPLRRLPVIQEGASPLVYAPQYCAALSLTLI